MKRTILVACLFALAFSMVAGAEEIKIGVRPVPPYVMQDKSGSFSGLEYEIIASALAVKGHTLKPSAYPLNRLAQAFKDKEVAAAAPLLPSSNAGGTLSDVYLVYTNIAMALKSSGLDLKSPADLKGHSVIAFPNAKVALGADFAAAIEGNPKYTEDPQQVTQIRLLFAKRVEVAVGEERILNYFIRDPSTGVDTSVPVSAFKLFGQTAYRVAFQDPKLAADFNEGLKTIKSNGSYDKLIQKYSK
jgi:polar amino acid transport system substrate-binding protein